MKVSDYMVKFLEDRGMYDVFGIPGVGCGHFMNSMIGSKVTSHLVYHEQAAAFAVCAYSQAAKKAGFAYTTAGPGGTNLITGIANAYCDSIPAVFMVGEKDSASLKGELKVRQRASQEVDIVEVCRPITKWSYQVTKAEEIRYVFEKAFHIAEDGRPGPVVLDIPSDIARDDVDAWRLPSFEKPEAPEVSGDIEQIISELNMAEKPLFLIGNGIKQLGLEQSILEISKEKNIPIITTLLAFDLLTGEEPKIGYMGLDGDLAANWAVNESDFIVILGARLNFKQVTEKRTNWAPKARIVRIDCDEGELGYKLRDELSICADLNHMIPALYGRKNDIAVFGGTWIAECKRKREELPKRKSFNPVGDAMVREICKFIPEDVSLTVDTGSHRRWVMSQFEFKKGQRLYQSAGLASMGYALPAAIGAYYGTKKPMVCMDGDGGIMMNLQELQFLCRDRLPITVVVFNNHCLGDIMEFQKRVFDKNYFTTTEDSGYQAADYERIASAFHMPYKRVAKIDEVQNVIWHGASPQLIEVVLPANA